MYGRRNAGRARRPESRGPCALRYSGRYANLRTPGRAGAMRIRRVDVYAVRYTLAGGAFTMSGGRVASEQDATVVRIETDDGLVGWGEQCVFSPNFLPAHGGGARATLELLGPAVLGRDPRRVDVVYAAMDAAVKGHAYAKSAVDIACWDLLGKATGMRVADLLGGAFQEEIPLYTGIAIAAPDEMRRRAAVTVEQPCATIEECRAVRARSRLPFVLDESLVDLAALEHARDAADAVRLK